MHHTSSPRRRELDPVVVSSRKARGADGVSRAYVSPAITATLHTNNQSIHARRHTPEWPPVLVWTAAVDTARKLAPSTSRD